MEHLRQTNPDRYNVVGSRYRDRWNRGSPSDHGRGSSGSNTSGKKRVADADADHGAGAPSSPVPAIADITAQRILVQAVKRIKDSEHDLLLAEADKAQLRMQKEMYEQYSQQSSERGEALKTHVAHLNELLEKERRSRAVERAGYQQSARLSIEQVRPF